MSKADIKLIREKKVAKAVNVPLIITNDGAVHKDSTRMGKTSHQTLKMIGMDGSECAPSQRSHRRDVPSTGVKESPKHGEETSRGIGRRT